MNPLALSLSHPPANPPSSLAPTPTPPSSRHSSRAATLPRPSKKKPKLTPRPPPPEIPLPDPSDLPPANFFRSQSALLGTAGLVGGIQPAKLLTHHPRGTDVSNPIVIDDGDDDAPMLGRPSTYSNLLTQSIDPDLLPTPSFKDIMAVLIAQKDTVPVLQSFIKLLTSASAASSHKNSSRSTSSVTGRAWARGASLPTRASQDTPFQTQDPPPKKRKLNRVPAGAADWDVPFPFAQGEGPEQYKKNWERERTKQLWFQLVGLVKTAIRKAAVKAYLQSLPKSALMQMQQAPSGPQASTSISGDAEPCDYHSQSTTDSPLGAGSNQPVQLEGTGVSEAGSQAPLDQYISSLFAMSFEQSVGGQMDFTPPLPAPAASMTSGLNIAGGTTGQVISNSAEQEVFDSWMTIFQMLPNSSEAVPDSNPKENPQPSAVATEEDFGFLDMNFDISNTTFDPVGTTSDSNQSNIAMQDRVELADSIIDPRLLAISIPQPPASTTNFLDNLPSLTASPMPSSTSSFEDFDPATPNSGWDLSMPSVVANSNVDGVWNEGSVTSGDAFHTRGLRGQGMWGCAIRNNMTVAHQRQGMVEDDLRAFLPVQEHGKEKAMDSAQLPPTSASFMSSSAAPYHSTDIGYTGSTSDARAPPARVSKKPLNKADVLHRAAERKKWLQDELQRVKTQLWETTIEQAILTHMNHEPNDIQEHL